MFPPTATAWSTASLKLNWILLWCKSCNKLSELINTSQHHYDRDLTKFISNLHQESTGTIHVYLYHDLLWLLSNCVPLHWSNPLPNFWLAAGDVSIAIAMLTKLTKEARNRILDTLHLALMPNDFCRTALGMQVSDTCSWRIQGFCEARVLECDRHPMCWALGTRLRLPMWMSHLCPTGSRAAVTTRTLTC